MSSPCCRDAEGARISTCRPAAAESTDVVACPGTTTCRIGITNSPGFAHAAAGRSRRPIRPPAVLPCASRAARTLAASIISAISASTAWPRRSTASRRPHYQIHIGGEARLGAAQAYGRHLGSDHRGRLGADRAAPAAPRLCRAASGATRACGQWGERLGKDGINQRAGPAAERRERPASSSIGGDEEGFKGAPGLRGECAAPFASDDILANFADDALIQVDRWLSVGRDRAGRRPGIAAKQALAFGVRRVLHLAGRMTDGRGSGARVCSPTPRRLHLLTAGRGG